MKIYCFKAPPVISRLLRILFCRKKEIFNRTDQKRKGVKNKTRFRKKEARFVF